MVKYRPEIDGLRAIAVVPVVLYHAGLSGIPGGFAGVDVFFVISGFLITRIIAEEARERRFSFWRFYERRARRILPALFVVMLVSLPIAWVVMVPYQLEDFAQSIVATLAFLSNVLFWFEADYFAVEAEFKPLLHTWSLAVEEQFYVFFPILLILVYRLGERAVLAALALAGVVSFAAALLYGVSAPSATFFLIQFRAWELLIGALAALWIMRSPPAPNDALAGLGLGMILLSFFVVSEKEMWPGPLTLLPVVGCALVTLFASADSRVGRCLAFAPVRGIGLISYSLYLWHLPLLVFLNIAYFGDAPAVYRTLAVVLSVVLAWLSWRFVERPFRTPGLVPIKPFAAVLVIAALPLAAFGLVGERSKGFQNYIISRLGEEAAGRVIVRAEVVAERRPVWDEVRNAGTRPFPEDGRRKVLILGDSLSVDLLVATADRPERFPGTAFRRLRLDDPCMPVLHALLQEVAAPRSDLRCPDEATAVLESPLFAAADEIVLAASWLPETAEGGISLAELLATRGQDVSIQGTAVFNDMASLSVLMARTDVPVPEFMYENIRVKFLPVNAAFEALAEAQPRVRFLDKLALFCDLQGRTCDVMSGNGRPMIYDAYHVTLDGVEVLSDRIARAGWFD